MGYFKKITIFEFFSWDNEKTFRDRGSGFK